MKANNIQEYLGTLQQTVVTSWRKHLKSEKHSEHVILNDFYDDMLDAVDELTEAYQAQNEKVENYVNLFDKTKKMTALEYVQAIYDFTKENRDIVGDSSEIQSLVDDILSVCDTAIYKLKDLVESNCMDLKDFLTESMMINEAHIFTKIDKFLNSKSKIDKFLKSKKIEIPNIIDYLKEINDDVYNDMIDDYIFDATSDDIDYEQEAEQFLDNHEELEDQIYDIMDLYIELFDNINS